jgi:hypothetical protein
MNQTGSGHAAGARAPRKMKATTLWPFHRSEHWWGYDE